MNLACSLLAACERHPELEAFPGIPYGELLPSALPRLSLARRRPVTSWFGLFDIPYLPVSKAEGGSACSEATRPALVQMS